MNESDTTEKKTKKRSNKKKSVDSETELRDVERGNWLATGKRRRRPRDLNAWGSSIPTKYEHVLCLGMSYAESIGSENLLQPLESVEQAVELVRRNILTEMDGRDLARCLALEESNKYLAYTVSLCSSAKYSRRHLSLNFNRANFSREMKNVWGPRLRFKQIILDYFWIPSGSWMMDHWKKSFFENTIPSFVTQELLMPDEGAVYLPFCLYVVGQLISAGECLARYYNISFLYKDQLSENALWLATSQISPAVMQNWFGKAINQEEVYCTLTPSEVYNSIDFDNFRKQDVLNVLRGIENFDNVRMIKLQVLKTNDNSSHKPPPGTLYVPGFIGLKLHHLVTKGIDHSSGGKLHNIKTTTKNVKRKRTTRRVQPALCPSSSHDEFWEDMAEEWSDDKLDSISSAGSSYSKKKRSSTSKKSPTKHKINVKSKWTASKKKRTSDATADTTYPKQDIPTSTASSCSESKSLSSSCKKPPAQSPEPCVSLSFAKKCSDELNSIASSFSDNAPLSSISRKPIKNLIAAAVSSNNNIGEIPNNMDSVGEILLPLDPVKSNSTFSSFSPIESATTTTSNNNNNEIPNNNESVVERLLSLDSIKNKKQLVGKRVLIQTGHCAGRTGTITRWLQGWMEVEIDNGEVQCRKSHELCLLTPILPSSPGRKARKNKKYSIVTKTSTSSLTNSIDEVTITSKKSKDSQSSITIIPDKKPPAIPDPALVSSTYSKSPINSINPTYFTSSYMSRYSKDVTSHSPSALPRSPNKKYGSRSKKSYILKKFGTSPFTNSTPDEITITSKNSKDSQSSITTSDFDSEIALLGNKLKNSSYAPLKQVYRSFNKDISYRRARKKVLLNRAAVDDINQLISGGP